MSPRQTQRSSRREKGTRLPGHQREGNLSHNTLCPFTEDPDLHRGEGQRIRVQKGGLHHETRPEEEKFLPAPFPRNIRKSAAVGGARRAHRAMKTGSGIAERSLKKSCAVGGGVWSAQKGLLQGSVVTHVGRRRIEKGSSGKPKPAAGAKTHLQQGGLAQRPGGGELQVVHRG